MTAGPVWDSELFFLQGANREALNNSLSQLIDFIAGLTSSTNGADPAAATISKDIAYTLNCHTFPPGSQKAAHRLAIVATSLTELSDKLKQAQELLADHLCQRFTDESNGIYYTTPEAVLTGKLAFVYPGLGSAYVNMLSELRTHFPSVRLPFETVDAVAMASGASVAPSNEIFPADGIAASSAQSLAASDFAVIAVLLAEYALYDLLQKLEISPDALIGCSTGEFAAVTTGGAIDVLSAVETFYKLSTRLTRGISASQLNELRSLRIFASCQKISELFPDWRNDIFLTADLGTDHIMVTGARLPIEKLAQLLRQAKIGFFTLSMAVPYHTPLVAGIVDANQSEVRALTISNFNLPTWSCSTGMPYPEDFEAIRHQLTELFIKPIALRQTIQAVYNAGARIFVEVGPNDVMTASVHDILDGCPHIAVASNRASRSSLAQIHHLLGVLLTNAVPANLEFLYLHRQPQVLQWQSSSGHSQIRARQAVLSSFLQTTTAFYNNAATVQATVMKAYIEAKTNTQVKTPDAANPASIFKITRHPAQTRPSVPAIVVQIKDVAANAIQLDSAASSWLTASELEFHNADSRPDSRKRHWLLGRLAARHAVKLLILEHCNIELNPLQIAIDSHQSGCPTVQFAVTNKLPPVSISITHTGDSAYAMATLASHGYCGIDAEIVAARDPDFASTFLNDNELLLLKNLPQQEKGRQLIRLWSAKEALYKAFAGTQLLSSFQIINCAPDDNWLVATQADQTLYIHSACTDNLVISQTVSIQDSAIGKADYLVAAPETAPVPAG